MATTIEYPSVFAREDTRHINSIEFPALPIRGDDVSVARYRTENSLGAGTYTADNCRVSNDGARLYNFYDATRGEWLNEFGYSGIVLEIVEA